MKKKSVEPVARREFGRFLAAARKQAELRQHEAAKKIGYESGQFISNWERGTSLPPTKKFDRISKTYKLQKKELVSQYKQFRLKEVEEEISTLS